MEAGSVILMAGCVIKIFFLDGADFLILTRGMRDRFKIDGGSRLRSLLGQLNCSSNQRSEV